MKKSYHHGDLKKATLRKAVETIQKRGEVDFTLREIATSLKVSHSAVYRHFKSKKELLSAIAESGFELLTAASEKEVARSASNKRQLMGFAQAHLQFALKNPGHYRCMFHHELCGIRGKSKTYLAACESAFAVLEKLVEAGMKNGSFKKGPTKPAAQFVWSTLHGHALLSLDGHLASNPEAHLLFIEKSLAK